MVASAFPCRAGSSLPYPLDDRQDEPHDDYDHHVALPSEPQPSISELLVVVAVGAAHVCIELVASVEATRVYNVAAGVGVTAYLIWRATTTNNILRVWGMRRDNFWQALRVQLIFGGPAAACLILFGLMNGTVPLPPSFWLVCALYPFFGIAQQFVLQNLIARNLTMLVPHQVLLAFSSALLFSLSHIPRLPLSALALIAGFVGVIAMLVLLGSSAKIGEAQAPQPRSKAAPEAHSGSEATPQADATNSKRTAFPWDTPNNLMLFMAQNLKEAGVRTAVLRSIATELAEAGDQETATEVAMKIDDPWLKASAFSSIASSLAKSGKNEEALARLEQAIEVAQRIEYVSVRPLALSEIAKAQVEAGSTERALTTLKQALACLSWIVHHVVKPDAELDLVGVATVSFAGVQPR